MRGNPVNKQTATELQKLNACNNECVTWSKNGSLTEYRKWTWNM